MNRSSATSRTAAVLLTAAAGTLGTAGCGNGEASGPHTRPPAATPTGSVLASGRVLPALDGVYVSDVTPAELRRHGSPDALDENIGHFVFVFANGINVQGQESVHACTWSVHSVTDHGNGLLTLSTLGAGGIAPNNANAKVGEPDGTLHWTLYRGILTLQPTGPERFWIKPLRQVSRTPGLGWFSHRCPPPRSALKPG